jgi:hypothetical protein
MNNERLLVLANTLLNGDIMIESGLIFDITHKGAYKNSTATFSKSWQGLESSKERSCITGASSIGSGLKAWL